MFLNSKWYKVYDKMLNYSLFKNIACTEAKRKIYVFFWAVIYINSTLCIHYETTISINTLRKIIVHQVHIFSIFKQG